MNSNIPSFFQTKIRPFLSLRTLIGGGVIIIFGAWGLVFQTPPLDTSTTKQIVKEKKASVLVFGEWFPTENREILATLESPSDIDILAETTGTIDKVFVNIGDRVQKGAVLAKFKQENNIGAINYQNALQLLSTTQISTDSSIQSAQIAFDAAQQEIKQIELNESHNNEKNKETLITTTRNSESTISQVLNWADDIFGATTRYRYTQSRTKYNIGNNSSIEKQFAKTQIESLVRRENQLQEYNIWDRESNLLVFSGIRLEMLQEIQTLTRLIDTLIFTTGLSSSFTETDRNAFKTQSDTMITKIDTQISTLEQAIENAKSETNRMSLSLISAQSRIQTTKASLDLAKSNAKTQTQSAQNQVSITQITQNDLFVRAPFDGKITEKYITPFSQINSGQKLFSLFSHTTIPKVISFMSESELERLLTKDVVQIQLSDDKIYEVNTTYLSYKIDPLSQKIKTEFVLNEIPTEVLIGSFAKILVPLKNKDSNLLPISSLSFEPDGVEVLILDEKNIAHRQKIQYSQIISDSVEVSAGLGLGARVIEFRKRVHAGEQILWNPKEK